MSTQTHHFESIMGLIIFDDNKNRAKNTKHLENQTTLAKKLNARNKPNDP